MVGIGEVNLQLDLPWQGANAPTGSPTRGHKQLLRNAGTLPAPDGQESVKLVKEDWRTKALNENATAPWSDVASQWTVRGAARKWPTVDAGTPDGQLLSIPGDATIMSDQER